MFTFNLLFTLCDMFLSVNFPCFYIRTSLVSAPECTVVNQTAAELPARVNWSGRLCRKIREYCGTAYAIRQSGAETSACYSPLRVLLMEGVSRKLLEVSAFIFKGIIRVFSKMLELFSGRYR